MSPFPASHLLSFLFVFAALTAWICPIRSQSMGKFQILEPEKYQHYVDSFNRNDQETTVNYLSNEKAWNWMVETVPFFDCPDKSLEEIYYFRWWTFRKHIKQTPEGIILTEFLPLVPWAGKYNSISCAAGHHFYEGRWMRERSYLDDYAG